MKKILALVIGISLVAALGIVLSGCGQQTPSISTSSNQPKGLTIRGTVFGTTYFWDTSYSAYEILRGTSLAGVVLTLSGNSVNKTTTTDSKGEYVFTDLPQNAGGVSQSNTTGYTIVATKEGYQRMMAPTAISSSSGPLPDNSEVTLDIDMKDQPVVLSMSPSPGTTVEAGPLSVTVQFNEAMDPTSVRPSITASGLRTFAVGDILSLTTSWSNNNKTLVITSGSLLPNQTYYLQLDPGSTAKDASGNILDSLQGPYYYDTGSGGISWQIYNGLIYASGWIPDPNKYYRTASGGVLGAPSNISVTLNNLLPADADFSDVITGGNNVRLHWDTPTSGQITGYRAYVSLSSSGPWNLFDTITDGSNQSDKTISSVNTSIFGTDSVDPVCYNKWAFENNKIYFRVVAFNGEGESSAATAEAREGKGPQIDNKAYSGRSGGGGFAAQLLNNYYYLPALTDGTDTKVAYIAFYEPINALTVTATNFAYSAGTITKAALLTSSSGNLTASWGTNVYSVVKLTSDTAFSASDLITVEAGVKDLAGNPVVTGTGDTATIQ